VIRTPKFRESQSHLTVNCAYAMLRNTWCIKVITKNRRDA
jgi:hypothetical protein